MYTSLFLLKIDAEAGVVVLEDLFGTSRVVVNADVVDETVEICVSSGFANINSIAINIDWEGCRGLTLDTIHVIGVADFGDMLPDTGAGWFDP